MAEWSAEWRFAAAASAHPSAPIRFPGIRAALIHDHFSARQGVEDDHINIICLGGRTDGSGRGLGFGADVPGSRVQSGTNDTCAGSRKSLGPGAARRDA